MNLLLLERAEVTGDPARPAARISDRRAQHLREVLRVTPGATVRAGIIGGATGQATVVSDDGTTIELALEPVFDPALVAGAAPEAPMPVDLVLAMPRPKVLSRALETAAAFGLRRVDIVNAWRVDKSYLDSPRLEAASITEHLRLGAEQGVTTHLPAVQLHPRLMPFLNEHHPAEGAPASTRLLAHARGAVPIEQAWRASPRTPITLAIGPEGGWIEREVETFATRGFAVVTLGAPVLRCEVALAAALGQLALLLRA
ncbi:MAG TPA: RsmE family RNA methyltransferase [Kofleriaceae bacterium]|nr:RsmE family RNA methyltransferase [Kofleriaceae bacterium]